MPTYIAINSHYKQLLHLYTYTYVYIYLLVCRICSKNAYEKISNFIIYSYENI